MNPVFLVLALTAFVVIAALFSRTFYQPYRRSIARKKSRALGIEGVPGSEAAIEGRLIAVNRGGLAGAGLGLVVSVLVASTLPDDGIAAAYVAEGAILLGFAVGLTGTILALESRRTSRDVRVARVSSVSLGDYLSVSARVCTWATIGLAISIVIGYRVLFAAYGVSGNDPDDDVISGFIAVTSLTICAIASMLLVELAGRALIRKGQPVGSADELAQDDALRSNALWGLMYAPGLCTIYVVQVTPYLARSLNLPGVAFDWIEWTILASFIAILAVNAVLNGFAMQRRYLKRLWPALASERMTDAAYWAEVAEHEELDKSRRRRKAEAG